MFGQTKGNDTVWVGLFVVCVWMGVSPWDVEGVCILLAAGGEHRGCSCLGVSSMNLVGIRLSYIWKNME